MNRNSYSLKDRQKVVEQSKNIENQMKVVNLGFAYNMYDIMRLQLEELHRIGNAMESILRIIQN